MSAFTRIWYVMMRNEHYTYEDKTLNLTSPRTFFTSLMRTFFNTHDKTHLKVLGHSL